MNHFNLGIHLGTFFLYMIYASPNFFSKNGSSLKIKNKVLFTKK